MKNRKQYVNQLHIQNHHKQAYKDKGKCYDIKSHKGQTFNQNKYTKWKTDDTCYKAGNIFSDINCMTNVNKEMRNQRNKNSKPQGI